jgi:hypothetical protein
MIRLTGLGLLTFGLVVALLNAADEPAADKPEPPVRLKKKDRAAPPAVKEPAPEKAEPGVRLKKKEKGDAVKDPEQGPDEQTKELLARVAKNMETSEDRLKKQDPSEKTRKIQDQIVKDLDELIKKSQQQEQQQQQQSASGSGGSSGKSGTAQGSRKSQRKVSKRGSSAQGSQQAKDNGSKPKPGEGLDKKNGGTGKKDQTAGAEKKNGKGQQGKEASASKDGGGGNSTQKHNSIADLQRTEKDIWGHLPEAKRQEMDAYARDRFMPKYDELLRQYYRTISEQSRKKDGD